MIQIASLLAIATIFVGLWTDHYSLGTPQDVAKEYQCSQIQH